MSKPGPKPKRKIQERDVVGLKYFRKLRSLFDRLHDDGCNRDRAGNRQLHFDQYCCLVMLFMFNPIVSSLRAIQQASELKNVQRKLGCARASLGSLSESARVFDPALLGEVVRELGRQLMPIAKDARLAEVKHLVTLVDGTLLKALPRITQAMWLTTRTGTAHHAWRLHTHFELDKHVPVRMDLTIGRNSGQSDEREVLESTLQKDRCYVMDRGYAKFALFNAIDRIDSSYVCRVRDNGVYPVIEQRSLSDEAIEADVLSDQIIALGQGMKADRQPDHPVRLVCVATTPHDKRSNRKGKTGAGPSDGVLRIVTNLIDVPADVIALLYHYRFTIEVFFRFFKHVLGCRHLLSDDPGGIEIQTYCAIIACMLITLYAGRKPTLRTYEMVCYYFTGLADEQELLAHIAKLQSHA
jgi:hypothetical protein